MAHTLSSKFSLHDLVRNELFFDREQRVIDVFVTVRSSHAAHVLENMDIDVATGPDGLSRRVLKECACGISLPLAKLIRRIIAQCFWPNAWTIHWLFPLYKRKAVSNPENYRAINLTAQISKAVERFLHPFFGKVLEDNAFGQAQFAYRNATGHAMRFYITSFPGSLGLTSAAKSASTVQTSLGRLTASTRRFCLRNSNGSA